jgi:hypothetical protein
MTFGTLYITALFLAMPAPEHCARGPIDRDAFCEYFGDLRRSLLSCFMTMYGGVYWGMLLEALAEVGAVYAAVFICFLIFAFTILANLVTGIFLELLRECSTHEKQLLVNNEMRRIAKQVHHLEGAFIEIDVNQSGTISKDELEMAVHDPRMRSLLSALNLGQGDISTLFALLDKHRVGAVSIKEFVEGCMELSGDARAVHFQAVRLDLKKLERKLRKLDERLSGRKLADSGASPKHDRGDEGEMPSKIVSFLENSRAITPYTRAITRMFAAAATPLTPTPAPQMSDIWGHAVSLKDHQPIQLAEHRAMSLWELRNVWRIVQLLCVEEEWHDPESGKKLLPDSVNLYTFSYNHICPKSVIGGVTLVGLTVNDELMRVGVQVEQRDTKWSLPRASGIVDRFEDGDPVITVTHGRFEGMTSTSCHVFLEDIDCGVPAEVIPELALSYKELVSNAPLKPQCSARIGGV